MKTNPASNLMSLSEKFAKSTLVMICCIFAQPIYAVTSPKFPDIHFASPPDLSAPTDLGYAKKIATELGRPCDVNEASSWAVTNPSVTVAIFSTFTNGALSNAYNLYLAGSNSATSKSLNATTYIADAKDTKGHFVLIWTSSDSTLTLALCGDKAALAAHAGSGTPNPAPKGAEAPAGTPPKDIVVVAPVPNEGASGGPGGLLKVVPLQKLSGQ